MYLVVDWREDISCNSITIVVSVHYLENKVDDPLLLNGCLPNVTHVGGSCSTFQFLVEAVLHIISSIFCCVMNINNYDVTPAIS
jgi:hypothetical protein